MLREILILTLLGTIAMASTSMLFEQEVCCLRLGGVMQLAGDCR